MPFNLDSLIIPQRHSKEFSNNGLANGDNRASSLEREQHFESLLNRVNLHHLYYFWVAAKSGSIRKASMQLLLAPATVSRQIKDLEAKLGVQLLIRSNQSIKLTAEGIYVFGICGELFGLARELVESVEVQSVVKSVRLSVGIAGAIPKLLVYKLLEPALHLREKVQIVCVDGAPAKLIGDLANGTVDLILTDTTMGSNTNMRSYTRPIVECPVVVCGNSALTEKYKHRFPKSLHGAPVLLPTNNTALRNSIEKFFIASHIMPDVRGEFEDSTLIKVFGEAGLGLFFVPEVILEEVLNRYQCKALGSLEAVVTQFFAIAAQRRINNPATKAIFGE